MEFSYFTRKRDLEKLNGSFFDVVIVGGGIAGAGIASLLSSNKVKVLLVDKGDFASGTSSNSSKLIHGGLRYLAQGHLLLTRELLKERNYLVRNVDIVQPMKFDILIDVDSWGKKTLYMGLLLYNILGGKFRLPNFIKGKYSYDGYSGHFTYEDAATDDALLVVYNVATFVKLGGTAINYLEATRIKDTEKGVEITLKDKFDMGEYSVSGKIVLNATGPWVNEIYGSYTSERINNLQLTRGAHIIVRKDKLSLDNAVVFRSHLDGRQMFVIPRGEVVLIGTTDDFTERPDSLTVKNEEREYILNSAWKIFPSLTSEDVVGEYVGIRPLYGKGSDPGRVTRDFYVDVTGRMVTVMGVKITNYRNAARKIARRLGRILNVDLKVDGLPLILYKREGDEIDSALRNECALTVDDVLKRRVGHFYFKTDQGRSTVEGIKKRIEDYFKTDVK